MNAPINKTVLNDSNGNPAFVVLPYDEYLKYFGTPDHQPQIEDNDTVPHEVVKLIVLNDWSPVRAWREHLGLKQSDVAERMGISQAAYSKMEKSDTLRKSTRQKIAEALGITQQQLNY